MDNVQLQKSFIGKQSSLTFKSYYSESKTKSHFGLLL
jgi:hypothetical protein